LSWTRSFGDGGSRNPGCLTLFRRGPFLLACLRLRLCGGGCCRCNGGLCGAGAFGLLTLGLGAFDLGTLGGGGFCGLQSKGIRGRLLRGDFGCRGRDIRGLATTTNLRAVHALWCGGGRRLGGDSGGRAATAATCGRWRSGLPLGTNALLALPPRPHARDLIVGQRAQMAAHGNIHLTK
jgi:hypothetical protein